MKESLEPARVIASYGKEYLVETNGSGSQRVNANRKAGKAVCGDNVLIDDTGLLKTIEPRHSEYIRPDFRQRPRVLAANINTLVWITSHAPPNDPLIAARALIVSRLLKLDLVFIQSKLDQLPDEHIEHLSQAQKLAQECDIPLYPVSSKKGTGLAPLTEALRGKTCLIVGQSGVGKSTLVTQLTGDDSIRTQSLSEATGHGRHTTTTASLYKTPDGNIELIDAPGMRDIGLWEMKEPQLLEALPELTRHGNDCRFSNCQHDKEPDCAVKQAIADGKVPDLLYQAYRDAKDKALLS